MYALILDENYRILTACDEKYAPAGAPLVAALPSGDITKWIYKDGQYSAYTGEDPSSVESHLNLPGAVLIWENASPNSSYGRSARPLNFIPSENPYDALVVICNRGRGSNFLTPAVYMPRSDDGLFYEGSANGSAQNWIATRRFHFGVNSSGYAYIQFEWADYYYIPTQSQNTEDDRYCIPVFIIGIKRSES